MVLDAAAEFEKRKARAARFGLPVPVSAAEEKAKVASRSDRFGTADAKAGEQPAKRPAPTPPADPEWEAKKAARAARFGAAT